MRTRILCPVCGSDQARKAQEKNGYTIVACAGCGLRFVNPQPDNDEMFGSYQEFYVKRYAVKRRKKMRDAWREFARITRCATPGSPPRLLDIGCGCGFLLSVARRRGWDAVGIDLCGWQVDYARRELGVEAVHGRFPDDLPEGAPFDVITMFDVLEHLSDPLAGLRRCYEALARGGTLIVGTPDGGHPRARQMGAQWPHLCPPQHLFYFTPEHLASLAEKAGFVSRGLCLRPPWRDTFKAVFVRPA